VLPLAFVFGSGAAVFWLGIQTTVVTHRPDRIGTAWAVIAVLSLPALAIPPAIGALADRFGLTAGMTAFACVQLAVVLLTRVGPRSRS